MSELRPRRATHDDVAGIQRLVLQAFGKYVDRIGRPPAPMAADYAELLSTSRVWVIDLEFYPRRGFHETGRAVQDGFHRIFFAKTV